MIHPIMDTLGAQACDLPEGLMSALPTGAL
jgi:hypothetical protein